MASGIADSGDLEHFLLEAQRGSEQKKVIFAQSQSIPDGGCYEKTSYTVLWEHKGNSLKWTTLHYLGKRN